MYVFVLLPAKCFMITIVSAFSVDHGYIAHPVL